MSMQLGSRYELLEVLGRGGSGQVWSATSPDGPVAVKVLRPELSEDPEIVDRFIAERRLLTGLHSPHIVGVRDLVIEGDRLAIVMDLVTGGDLRSHLREAKTLAPSEALDTMAQVLDGLAAVHEAGVIHRDLKPENILLASGDGPNRVRVADFGIARLSSTTRTTRTTGLVGTPRYIAPELAIRGQVSPAVDVYAAGVTLYELLFGRVPFDGPHPAAVLRAQAEDPPHRPDRVPDKLWTAIAAMLEKNPADRPTAAEAAERLRKLSVTLGKLPAFAPLPPSLGSDTDDTHTTDPHDNATDATGIGRRGVPQPGPVTSPTVGRKRSRLVAAIAIALVLGLLGGIMLFQSRDTAGAALPFRVEDTSQGSLTVEHHWSFASKRGDKINGTMTVAPSHGHTISKTTTALAVFPPALSQVTFDPSHPIIHDTSATAGKSVLRPGVAVAQFTIRKGSSQTTLHYHVTVRPGTTSSTRFEQWAEELRSAAGTLCASADPPSVCNQTDHLVDISFTNPTPPPIEVLGTFPAAPLLQGRTKHGSTLTANKIHGITWHYDPTKVVVDPTTGVVTGITPGTTLITATLGNLTTTTPLWITINPPPPTPTPSPTTPTLTKDKTSTTTQSTVIVDPRPPTTVPHLVSITPVAGGMVQPAVCCAGPGCDHALPVTFCYGGSAGDTYWVDYAGTMSDGSSASSSDIASAVTWASVDRAVASASQSGVRCYIKLLTNGHTQITGTYNVDGQPQHLQLDVQYD